MQDKLNHKVHFRAEGDIISPSASEVLLRDNLITLLRDSGIEVIDDVEEGQRVLAAGNASIKQMTAKQKRALETVSFSQDKSYHQTVISSADGAKVLNNLDTLVKEYENSIHTKEKTFIGTLAEKLEAHKHGSNSEYASFETMNGRVITIRLANHNAKVSTFYNHGENEGISIVVTPKDNDKLTNDGTAHVTEFYYNALKLRRADGQPLADIVRSIKQALYSGVFIDTTGLVERQEVNVDNVLKYQMAYHGSANDFDTFDTMSHLSEGEGNQAFGAGTYVADQKDLGVQYANIAYDNNHIKQTEHWNAKRLISRFPTFEDFLNNPKTKEAMAKNGKTIADLKAYYKNSAKLAEPPHVLYTLDIPDDNGKNYLDWDGWLSRKQADTIRERLYKAILALNDDYKGSEKYLAQDLSVIKKGSHIGDTYGTISDYLGSDKLASEFLHDLGYTGIKVHAAHNSNDIRYKDNWNYVIFNDKDLKIRDKIRFFRTSNGDAYGFTSGGKIYIDPRIATAETPIHEYAHLWGEALRKGNPEEWKNVVGLMKQETVIWDDVKKNYPQLESDDDIADEVLATYSGRQGAKKLRALRDCIVDSEDTVDNKRAALSSLERFRQLLSRLWKDISDLLHIHFTTAEEVADKVMSDLLNGFNPKVVAYSNDITKQQFSGQDFPLGTGKAAESDFYDVIDAMYSDPNFDRTSHLRDRYDIGSTPDWMKSIGISGDYFSLSFKNIKTHQGKDVDHDLTREEWYEVPEAIQHPFLVTKYKGASDRFRLYVNMLHNGHYVAVGIDVKRVNQGKNKPMLDVNSIKTVFAKGTERIADNEIPIAIDKNITPKQQALLHGHNFHEYPTIQELTVLELSIAKIDNISDNDVKKCEKLSEDSRINFQFIGEHGAASLDKSLEQTTRMDNLRIARQMEASNRDALSIKLATGWERGGDGLWRYEIDDSSYLAPSMTKDGTIYKLSDVLSGKGARELFAAYPEMRNFDVVYKQLDNNLSGWYNNGRIYLNNSLSQEESYVTILHEIQHAIQYNEGFSTGANVKDIRSRIANIIDNDRDNSEYAREQLRNWAYFRLARTRLNTYERLIQSSDTTSLSRAIDCYWEAMDAIDNDEHSILVNEYSDIDSSDDIAKSGYHVKEAKEELDRLAKLTYDSIPEGNMNSLKLVDKLTNALKEYSDKELYSLVGGEVEARNVERRMNMSLEERHRTLAAETEDVARKDQLFLQDENAVSAINDTDEIIGLQVEKLFNDALNGSFTGKPVSIGKLSQEGKTYLEHLSGLKMKEHVDFVLNPSDLKHIYNDHFGSNEKDSGNNIPLTSIDLRNVYKVLSHPDGVIYGVDKKDGRKLFFFLKKMPTGLYNLAEICSTKKGNLTAKSYYITKKGINQRVMEIKSSLLPTSVTYSGESLSTAKVPQLFESSVKKDEKLSDNTKIRFQFIGEHGAKNLDIADGKSSRIDNLRVAKNMDNAGRDALTIKVVTGWEKGADGKWRYEIMDPQYIDLSPSVQLSNLIKAKNKLPANTRKSLSRYENMSAMTKKQSDNYAALVSKSGLDKLGYHDEEMLREGHGNARLCELLTPRFSSSLFKAYPVLRDVHVNYMPMPFGELGSWNPQTKEIELTSNMDIPSESIRKSLLHEIQHAIQYMEGFCTGSSPEYYEAQLHETSEYQAMMKCKKELESINKWIHKDDSDETLYLRYKENEYSLSVIDKNVIRDAAIRLRKGDTYDDIYQDYLHKSKAAEQRFQEISSGNESPFMKYRRTGGEVEARNTEKRRNMHPDDRRNTLAVSTEDVPREQQIINTPEKETPSSDSLSVSGSSSNCFNAQELKESEGNSTLIKESPVVADIDDNIKWSPDTADNYEEAEEEDDEEEVKHSIHL